MVLGAISPYVPADKRRKLIPLRLLPEDVARLDTMVLRHTAEKGRIVHRSESVSMMLRSFDPPAAAPKNGKRLRSRATAP